MAIARCGTRQLGVEHRRKHNAPAASGGEEQLGSANPGADSAQGAGGLRAPSFSYPLEERFEGPWHFHFYDFT